MTYFYILLKLNELPNNNKTNNKQAPNAKKNQFLNLEFNHLEFI